MLTRCPNCQTIFRIREDQLNMADGLAHCYRCEQVFNARENLSETAVAKEPAAQESTPPHSEAAPISVKELLATPKKKRGFFTTLFWLLACTALLAAAALQLAWFERKEVIKHPEGRILLEKLCHYVHCEVPKLRDLSLINITQRQITSHPHKNNALLVQLTIKNQATFSQPYPILELSLSTTDEVLIARRSFSPAEYLEPATNHNQLMSLGMLQQIEMEIEDPGAGVTGFEFDFL